MADTVKAVNATGQPRFTGFYNDREITLATAQLNSLGWQGYAFEGGYEGAERKMLCVFEDSGSYGMPAFPIKAVRVAVPGGQGLTHRDYLGALLGTGLERCCFGDIVVAEEEALVYLQEKICEFVLQSLDSVGRLAADVAAVEPTEMPAVSQESQGNTVAASVPSLRLDAVLAAMLHVSRSDAAAYITRGLVMVNHLVVESLHYRVEAGDVFSVRGRGKYRLQQVGTTSRKKRIRIEYVQY